MNKMCERHWEQLRHAIKARGLWDLVAADGEELVARVASTERTIHQYDPLLEAWFMIIRNSANLVCEIEGHPMNLFAGEEPVCPICYLNGLAEEHDASCTDPKCTWPRGKKFEGWIDCAADGAKNHAEQLKKTSHANNTPT